MSGDYARKARCACLRLDDVVEGASKIYGVGASSKITGCDATVLDRGQCSD